MSLHALRQHLNQNPNKSKKGKFRENVDYLKACTSIWNEVPLSDQNPLQRIAHCKRRTRKQSNGRSRYIRCDHPLCPRCSETQVAKIIAGIQYDLSQADQSELFFVTIDFHKFELGQDIKEAYQSAHRSLRNALDKVPCVKGWFHLQVAPQGLTEGMAHFHAIVWSPEGKEVLVSALKTGFLEHKAVEVREFWDNKTKEENVDYLIRYSTRADSGCDDEVQLAMYLESIGSLGKGRQAMMFSYGFQKVVHVTELEQKGHALMQYLKERCGGTIMDTLSEVRDGGDVVSRSGGSSGGYITGCTPLEYINRIRAGRPERPLKTDDDDAKYDFYTNPN